jgi:peptidoglycan/LPS O-acetylase OafA/YrhL
MTMVIAQHSGLLPFGWTGVWLFYVISGFVITRIFVNDNAIASIDASAHYRSFLVRRAFRIIPPYAVYLVLCVVAALVVDLPSQARELPYLATFTYNWRMIFSLEQQSPLLGHLWTISVEEQFYLFFPWVVLLLSRDGAVRSLLTIVALGPVFRIVLSQYLSINLGFDAERSAFGVYASSLGQFDAFALGSLLAHFEGHIRRSPRIAGALMFVAVVIAAAYVTAYVHFNALSDAHGIDRFRNVVSGILYGQGREVLVYVAIDLVALATLAGAIAGWKIFKALENPILVSVGQASYSGYLVHLMVLAIVGQIIGLPVAKEPIAIRLALFCAVWCCTVAIARASYSLFERNFIHYGHQFSDRILENAARRARGLGTQKAPSDAVLAADRIEPV